MFSLLSLAVADSLVRSQGKKNNEEKKQLFENSRHIRLEAQGHSEEAQESPHTYFALSNPEADQLVKSKHDFLSCAGETLQLLPLFSEPD